MTQNNRPTKNRWLAQTCWFTAVLNAVFANAQAQNAGNTTPSSANVSAVPASATAPTTPSNPLFSGNPGDYDDGRLSFNPLQYGPFDIHLRAHGGVLYDDNINTSDKNKVSDVIWSLSPTVTVGVGDYRERQGNLLQVEYTPSFVLYTDNSDLSTINHAASGEGQWKQGPWQANLSQGYQHLFDTSLDAGGFLGRDIFTTALRGEYEISPKTSLEVNGRQLFNCVIQDNNATTAGNSFKEWVGEVFGNYIASPKLKLGLGFTAGWTDNQRSVDGTYQQIVARAIYTWTEKLSVEASAGGQIQQFSEFEGEKQDNRFNGIFSAGATYRPVEKTVVGLGVYRRDGSSISLDNQAYTATGFDVIVRQTITDRFVVGVSGGYAFSDYYSTIKTGTADRQDNYWRMQLNLDFQLMEQLTAGVFYQYRQDDSSGSTADSFSFKNNQVGLNVAYRF